jgi:hypothetical protein
MLEQPSQQRANVVTEEVPVMLPPAIRFAASLNVFAMLVRPTRAQSKLITSVNLEPSIAEYVWNPGQGPVISTVYSPAVV